MIDTKKKVVIIDYKLGNLFSVKQACDTVGMNAMISSDREDLMTADALLLPGVGAFNEGMNNLDKLDLVSAIKEKIADNVPLFGICLGQQLLFTESEEFGTGKGLDLIPGIIKKFPEAIGKRKIKVPHIAWNKIYSAGQDWQNTPLQDLDNNEFMYFIHSYFAKPADDSFISTLTNYDGIEFCSSVCYKNIFATQFHPEKSADKGISIYRNWALINNLL